MRRKGQALIVAVSVIVTIIVIGVVLLGIKSYLLSVRNNDAKLRTYQKFMVSLTKSTELKTKEILSEAYYIVNAEGRMNEYINNFTYSMDSNYIKTMPLYPINTNTKIYKLKDYRQVYYSSYDKIVEMLIDNNLRSMKIKVTDDILKNSFGDYINVENIYDVTPVNYDKNEVFSNDLVNMTYFGKYIVIESIPLDKTPDSQYRILKVVIPNFTTCADINLYIKNEFGKTEFSSSSGKKALVPCASRGLFVEFPDYVNTLLPYIVLKYALDYKNANYLTEHYAYMIANPSDPLKSSFYILDVPYGKLLFNDISHNHFYNTSSSVVYNDVIQSENTVEPDVPNVELTKDDVFGLIPSTIKQPEKPKFLNLYGKLGGYSAYSSWEFKKAILFNVLYAPPFISNMSLLANLSRLRIVPVQPFTLYDYTTSGYINVSYVSYYYIPFFGSYNGFFTRINYYAMIDKNKLTVDNLRMYPYYDAFTNVEPYIYAYDIDNEFADMYRLSKEQQELYNSDTGLQNVVLTPFGITLLPSPYYDFRHREYYGYIPLVGIDGDVYEENIDRVLLKELSYNNIRLLLNINETPMFESQESGSISEIFMKKLLEIENLTLPYTIVGIRFSSIGKNMKVYDMWTFNKLVTDVFSYYSESSKLKDEDEILTRIESTRPIPYDAWTNEDEVIRDDELVSYINSLTFIDPYVILSLYSLYYNEDSYPSTNDIMILLHNRLNQMPIITSDSIEGKPVTIQDILNDKQFYNIKKDEKEKLPVAWIDNDVLVGSNELKFSFVIVDGNTYTNRLLKLLWVPGYIYTNNITKGDIIKRTLFDVIVSGVKSEYVDFNKLNKTVDDYVNEQVPSYVNNVMGIQLYKFDLSKWWNNYIIPDTITISDGEVNVDSMTSLSRLFGDSYREYQYDPNYGVSISTLIPSVMWFSVKEVKSYVKTDYPIDTIIKKGWVDWGKSTCTINIGKTFPESQVTVDITKYKYTIDNTPQTVTIGHCTYRVTPYQASVVSCENGWHSNSAYVSVNTRSSCSENYPGDRTATVYVTQSNTTALFTGSGTVTFKMNKGEICYKHAKLTPGKEYEISGSNECKFYFEKYPSDKREIDISVTVTIKDNKIERLVIGDTEVKNPEEGAYVLITKSSRNVAFGKYFIAKIGSIHTYSNYDSSSKSVSVKVTFSVSLSKYRIAIPLIYNTTTYDKITLDVIVGGKYYAYDNYLLTYGSKYPPITVLSSIMYPSDRLSVDILYDLVMPETLQYLLAINSWYNFVLPSYGYKINEDYMNERGLTKELYMQMFTYMNSNYYNDERIIYMSPAYLILTGQTVQFPVKMPIKNLTIVFAYRRILGIDVNTAYKEFFNNEDILPEYIMYSVEPTKLEVDTTYIIANALNMKEGVAYDEDKLYLNAIAFDPNNPPYVTFSEYDPPTYSVSSLMWYLNELYAIGVMKHIKYYTQLNEIGIPLFNRDSYKDYGGTMWFVFVGDKS